MCSRLRIIHQISLLTPMGISFDDTKLDPSDRQVLTPGIKTALRRLHADLGHPTNDDLMRCLATGRGTRVAQRTVKGLRCSTCERMSRSCSHIPSGFPADGERFNEKLFVDLCDVVDVHGNRYWWLVAVDQHTDKSVIAPCPSHESRAVAKHIFKHWTRLTGLPDVLVCATGSGASEPRRFSQKNSGCQGLRCKPQQPTLRGQRVELSKGSPPSRKWRAG